MTDHEKILAIIRQKDQVPITIDPQKTALLVIDMQRYFVSPHYPLMQTFEKLEPGVTAPYCERVNATVIPNINRLQHCFRSQQSTDYLYCDRNLYGRWSRSQSDVERPRPVKC